MSILLPDLRGGTDHSLDFHRPPAVVKLERARVSRWQARLKAEGAAKEGNEAEAGQYYQLPVPAEEEKQEERDESGKD